MEDIHDEGGSLPLSSSSTPPPPSEISAVFQYELDVDNEKAALVYLMCHKRWDNVRARMKKTKRWREELRMKDWFGQLPLHHANFHGAPFDLMAAMVAEYPEAVRVTFASGRLPLHMACKEGTCASPREVRLLLDAYPEGAKVADELGDLPLHYAVGKKLPLETLTMLVNAHPEGVKAADKICGLPLHHAARDKAPLEILRFLTEAHPEGVGTRNIDGKLPLHLLAEEGVFPDVEEDVEKVDLLLRPLLDDEEACLAPSQGQTPLHIGAEFDLLNLHTCMRIQRCPADVIARVARRHPEQLHQRDARGDLPLHLVAANPNLNGSKDGDDDLIGRWVKSHPEAAAVPNADGRFPLILAIESGKRWDEGVEALVDAAEHVVTVRDGATGLFAFMSAATVNDPDVRMVYDLLIRCPELQRFILD